MVTDLTPTVRILNLQLNWSITNEEDVEDDITKIYDEGMLADAFD